MSYTPSQMMTATPPGRMHYLWFAGLALAGHLLLWQWGAISIRPTPALSPKPAPMTVQMRVRPPVTAAITPSTVPPARSLASSPARSQSRSEAMPAPPAASISQSEALTIASAVTERGAVTSTVDEISSSIALDPVTVLTPLTESGQSLSLHGYPAIAPDSAVLKTKLVSESPGKNPVYGVGEITFHVQDGRYQVKVQAGLDLLLTTLNLYQMQSEGNWTEFGLQPQTMSEKRRNRSETATHFQHDGQTISFSSSNRSTPLQAGAQDRASIFLQLSALGKGSPQLFQAGQQLRVQVAEDREAQEFLFQVQAKEVLKTRMGELETWHIIRPPRVGKYNSTLEIWLAPGWQWYPVQIRNTESNGTVTSQYVTAILPPEKGNS
ncbi:DUF3108 domain-containing protein [Undibacterium rugosum]|uniref:DUF3108 domain-containing protein n=1 Tax=Undibacterium rugosum TaxID=2762291 RepID=UPI001B821237|nr:DUF3108 domain-containing protein [Undibacterium rugosum]MBR7779149.1 DUF3108 domain-containing protein [Undibacterium rugosum]